MTQAGQMVNFPGGGEGYEDSGEGGLFVMLVVPRPQEWQDNCHVDVIADVRLSRSDVCVSPAGRELWEPWEQRKSDFATQSAAHKVLSALEYSELASWVLRARNQDEFSVTMLAAVHMGSTGASLWNPEKQEYWQATLDDLTTQGQVIQTMLGFCFGVEPVLLTFLDT